MKNQKGQAFIENLLYIAVFVLVVATFITGLSQAVGERFTLMTTRVNQIGN